MCIADLECRARAPAGDAVVELLVALALFAGALDYSKLAPLMQRMVQAAGMPEGDSRDWPAIRGWAASLLPKLVVVRTWERQAEAAPASQPLPAPAYAFNRGAYAMPGGCRP